MNRIIPPSPDRPPPLRRRRHGALKGGEIPTRNFFVDSLWHWHYSEVGKSGWLWWRRVSSGSQVVFRGTFETRIDDKGRVIFPVKFREVAKELGDDRLFVTNLRVGDVRCLEGRPYAEWLKLEARIADRNDLSPAAMEFYDNFYLPGAQECVIDKQGRLLIPPTLRDYAGLVKDIVFTGSRGKFRIWDKLKWQPVHTSGEQVGVNEPNVMSELGL